MKLKLESVGELFCGPGGGGLGASFSKARVNGSFAGIKHLWATDYDPDSCKTYQYNIQQYENHHLEMESSIKVVCDDINSPDMRLTNDKQFPYVDGLIFGFPCNDFSIVGESKGLNGKFGPLYEHGIEFLNRPDKPKWFIAENVSGLSSSNDGRAFEKILNEMRRAGYCLSVHKYKFEEYGIPQSRHRIIIVGFRKDLDMQFKVPAPSYITKTARQALEGIPAHATHQERTAQSPMVVERLRHIKPGENVWNAELPEHLRLNVPRTKLSHIYKRIDPDKPSYTVTGSGGGGTHMYHWDEPRALTNRERARLQTFPDWFQFAGAKESIRKQIGMAIPPEGMQIICEAILKTIYDVPYEFVEANMNQVSNRDQ